MQRKPTNVASMWFYWCLTVVWLSVRRWYGIVSHNVNILVLFMSMLTLILVRIVRETHSYPDSSVPTPSNSSQPKQQPPEQLLCLLSWPKPPGIGLTRYRHTSIMQKNDIQLAAATSESQFYICFCGCICHAVKDWWRFGKVAFPWMESAACHPQIDCTSGRRFITEIYYYELLSELCQIRVMRCNLVTSTVVTVVRSCIMTRLVY